MGWKPMSNGLWKVTSCCTQERDYSGAKWAEYAVAYWDVQYDCKPGGILGLEKGKRAYWHR